MGMLTRRSFGAGLGALSALCTVRARAAIPPMARVICDNDFSGDPDGLFQLAQHVLSRSIDIPLIVGSHLPAKDEWTGSTTTATDAANAARRLLRVMRRETAFTVLAGAEQGIASRTDWRPSPATAAIVREAMRTDPPGPLVYCAGASLTELALAWLAEPRIGPRVRLVWIGGSEHPGLANPPPNADPMEFNEWLDPIAAQILFNESDIEIWQVPRSSYRQMLVSDAELSDMAKTGPTGAYLVSRIEDVRKLIGKVMPQSVVRSETYVLGDSPLVTLTALQAFFQPDPSSSTYVRKPTPRLDGKGNYAENPGGRPMRVYTQIDSRLTFADMVSKFRKAGRK
ncbi:MAG: nucleoside hydrolase [Novosphingobium sp.]